MAEDLTTLHSHEEKLVLSYMPSESWMYVNESVKFICKISSINHPSPSSSDSKSYVNWHASYNGRQPEKIADSSTPIIGRYRISWNEGMKNAELEITMLKEEDSGEYHCEFIHLPNSIIEKSNTVRLNVTGAVKIISTETPNVTQCQEKRTNSVGAETGIILGVALVAFFLLLGLIVFMFTWRKRGNRKPRSGTSQLKKETPDEPVDTMDYSVLEFQTAKKADRLSSVLVPDNVEYATIMFPPSLPATGGWH
ncbi:programmed cell death protein 1 isoform X2 [Lissotriton helveticus]